MLFAISGWFRPDSEALRAATHEAFNEHLAQRTPRVRLAGPLRDAACARAGVLILLDARDFEAAQAFLRTSPYTLAGLYERVDVHALSVEVGSLG